MSEGINGVCGLDWANLKLRVDKKDWDALADIAHFYHLTRADYIRLQLKRIIAKEQSVK